MSAIYCSFLRGVHFDESGYAAPVALLLLIVSAVMATTLLTIAIGVSSRVSQRVDILTAYDLARAGAAAEISRLANGQPPASLDGTLRGGSYRATVVSGTGTNTPVIQSEGLTTRGGAATVWVTVNLTTSSVVAWREMP